MAVSALLICTSCVTKKKIPGSRKWAARSHRPRQCFLQEQLVDCKDAGDKLNERLAALQRDTAKMGSNIRNYQTMLNSNMTQQEKLNSLLSQKMEELNERERTINELQDMINAQNEKFKAAKQRKGCLIRFQQRGTDCYGERRQSICRHVG